MQRIWRTIAAALVILAAAAIAPLHLATSLAGGGEDLSEAAAVVVGIPADYQGALVAFRIPAELHEGATTYEVSFGSDGGRAYAAFVYQATPGGLKLLASAASVEHRGFKDGAATVVPAEAVLSLQAGVVALPGVTHGSPLQSVSSQSLYVVLAATTYGDDSNATFRWSQGDAVAWESVGQGSGFTLDFFHQVQRLDGPKLTTERAATDGITWASDGSGDNSLVNQKLSLSYEDRVPGGWAFAGVQVGVKSGLSHWSADADMFDSGFSVDEGYSSPLVQAEPVGGAREAWILREGSGQVALDVQLSSSHVQQGDTVATAIVSFDASLFELFGRAAVNDRFFDQSLVGDALDLVGA